MKNFIFRRFADNRRNSSLAHRLRLERVAFFKEIISVIPKPIKILDVGGTLEFWERMRFIKPEDIEIPLLNIHPSSVRHPYPGLKSIIGDARNMHQFKEDEFDIVFSNSVIEHVGGYKDQIQMSKEIHRVGKGYFIQTPNYFFPIEPHFMFPFFHFMPIWLRVFLLCHFNLGWFKKVPDKLEAKKVINSIHLLKKNDLKLLFPKAKIFEEKIFGLTNSFIVYTINLS